MKRRDFLQKAIPSVFAGGLLAGCRKEGGAGPAVVTRPHIRWRMVSSFPRSLETLFGAAEYLCRRLGEVTDGHFQIRPYPAGELVPGLQVLDAVQQGTVACGQTAGYYYTGKNPALAFETTMPFGLTARQQTAWLTESGGLDLINELLADFNVRSFYGGGTGAQMGGWFRREIPELSALKGLKMRIPGLGGEIMSRLGTTVQLLPASDIYMALERGAIDATEWVGPSDDEQLGFYKVAKNYYYPGWWEPGAAINYYVNLGEWAKLPPDYQAAFAAVAAEAGFVMMARYDRLNPEALDRLLGHGVQLRKFSDDVMAEARTISFDLMEERAGKDAAYRKVYEHWKKFRTASFRWFSTAELAYQSFTLPRG